MANNEKKRLIAVMLPREQVERLHYYSALTEKPIREIVSTALNVALPRDIKIIVKDRAAAKR